jgi:hypothetical protein
MLWISVLFKKFHEKMFFAKNVGGWCIVAGKTRSLPLGWSPIRDSIGSSVVCEY